jgi:hypothetical protein
MTQNITNTGNQSESSGQKPKSPISNIIQKITKLGFSHAHSEDKDNKLDELCNIFQTLVNHHAFKDQSDVNVTFKSKGTRDSYLSLVFIKESDLFEIKFFQHLSRSEMSGKTHMPFVHHLVLRTHSYEEFSSFFDTSFAQRVCHVEMNESDHVPTLKRSTKLISLITRWLKEFGGQHDHHGSFHPESMEAIFQHVVGWISANYGNVRTPRTSLGTRNSNENATPIATRTSCPQEHISVPTQSPLTHAMTNKL